MQHEVSSAGREVENIPSGDINNKGTDRYGQCLLEAEKLGYVELFNPTGSGNRCFYECIAKFFGKTVDETRKLIQKYMEEHKSVSIKDDAGDEKDEKLLSFFSDADFPDLSECPKTWDECRLAIMENQMANAVVIRLTASCFDINIKILRWNGSITEIKPLNSNGKSSVLLAYTGVHYILIGKRPCERGCKESGSFSGRSKSDSSTSSKSEKADGVIDDKCNSQKGHTVAMSSDGENRKGLQEGTDRYGQCLLEAEKLGYVELFNPTGSGNRCFYECIAKFIGKTVDETRKLIQKYMEEHKSVSIKDDDGVEKDETLLSFFSDADFPDLYECPKTWDECRLAIMENQMANAVVIRLTASCFDINIKILRWNGSITEIKPLYSNGKFSVVLAYTGVHYILLGKRPWEGGCKESESFSGRPKSDSSTSFKSEKANGVINDKYKSQKGHIVAMSSDGENRKGPQEDSEDGTKKIGENEFRRKIKGKFTKSENPVEETVLARQFSRLEDQNNLEEKYKSERDIACLENELFREENEELEKKYKVLEEKNKMLEKQLQCYRDRERDATDGTRISTQKKVLRKNIPHELAGFSNPFNCKVSCGIIVVLFVFFSMGLKVCNKRFISNLPEDAMNCSLSLALFREYGLITPEENEFTKNITNDYTIDQALQEAVETLMPEESYPALLVFQYAEKDGLTRAGHCVAIMPNGAFIDVQKRRYWRPSCCCEPISRICVVKVDEITAILWTIGCEEEICEGECYNERTPDQLD